MEYRLKQFLGVQRLAVGRPRNEVKFQKRPRNEYPTTNRSKLINKSKKIKENHENYYLFLF